MPNEQSEEGLPDSQNNEVLVLAQAAEIVDHSYALMRRGRVLRRLGNALRRCGLTTITGGSWAYLDETDAEIRFAPVPAHRLPMFIDQLEDLAALIAAQSNARVPAPVTGGATVNIHIDQLQIQFNFQPPGDGRPSTGQVA